MLLALTLFALLPAPTHAATGLVDSDLFYFGFVHNWSEGFPGVPETDSVEVCVSSGTHGELSPVLRKAATAATAGLSLCKQVAPEPDLVVTAKTFPADAVKDAFFNGLHDRPHPYQRTFQGSATGKEINDAYNALKKLCEGKGCGNFYVEVAHTDEAQLAKLPLTLGQEAFQLDTSLIQLTHEGVYAYSNFYGHAVRLPANSAAFK